MGGALSCWKFKELNRENGFGQREWVGMMEVMEQKHAVPVS